MWVEPGSPRVAAPLTLRLACQDAVGETVLHYCKIIPHGVLVFLPSYALLDKLQARWKSTGMWKQITRVKKPFAEPRGS